MKTCTLGIIYGMTAEGLARRLGCPVSEAHGHLKQFMGMFPALVNAVAGAAAITVRSGASQPRAAACAGTCRRVRLATRRDRNWMLNHPVQGSAATVFKAAGNRLYRLYPKYGAHLIIPMHDAFVFEAPIDRLQEVARSHGTRHVRHAAGILPRTPAESGGEHQIAPNAGTRMARSTLWRNSSKDRRHVAGPRTNDILLSR